MPTPKVLVVLASKANINNKESISLIIEDEDEDLYIDDEFLLFSMSSKKYEDFGIC